MKTLLHISLLVLFIVSCKTEKKKIIARYPNGKTSQLIVYPDQADRSSCTIFNYFESGKVELKVTIENVKYVGKKIRYFPSGQVYQIDSLIEPCDTSSNGCDGTLLRYNENGTISQRYTVRNKIFNGMSQHFSGNGTLIKEYELKNGMIRNGVYREFYPNGKISFEGHFQNNTIVGFGYYFDEKGDTVKYHNHYNGVLSFPYKKWLDNGNILFGNYYDNSEKIVVWKWFNKNGKQIKSKIAYAKLEGFAAPE